MHIFRTQHEHSPLACIDIARYCFGHNYWYTMYFVL